MAEDEEVIVFDTSVKKKKKKTKTIDIVDDEPAAAPAAAAAAADSAPAKAAEDDEEVPLDFGKKKKKKKVAIVLADDDAAVPESGEDKSASSEKESGDTAENEDDEEELDFSKKKKKKKTALVLDEEEPEEDGADVLNAWLGSNRDYTYNELLVRIFSILDCNNPDLVRSKRKGLSVQPPTVFREGTKKTVWANFADICKSMQRTTDHVMNFSLTELGTSGSLDGSQRLVIKGRFNPKQIESVIKHYITEYVTCRTCKSPDTNFKKENRIYFVQCKSCGSTRSVAAIKTGFQAQVGKRKKT